MASPSAQFYQSSPKCALEQSNAPRGFWVEAMSHSIDILNRVTGAPHGRCSSYEDLTTVRPRIMSIQPWGCRAWALTPAHTRSKLDASALEGINLGRSERQPGSFLIWIPQQLRTVSTSEATFDEILFPWHPPGQQRLNLPIPIRVDGESDQPPTLPPSNGTEPHRDPSNILATEFLRAARPAPTLAPKIEVARMSRRVLLLFYGAYTRLDGLVAYLQRHDMEVVPVDNDPTLGDKSHDVLIDTFYSDLLRRAQRGEFLAVRAAPPCSTFSVARFRHIAGGPPVVRRRPPDQVAQALNCPAKNRSEVRKLNELVNRTINILRAAHNAGSEFGIESPADHGDTNQPGLFVDADHAPLWVVPEIIALKTDTECTTITFPQCSLGAPWRKETTVMCTPALGFLLADLDLL